MNRKPPLLNVCGRNVNYHDLHPEFAARLLAATEAVGWLVCWLSAVRTFAQQAYLFAGWMAKKAGFALAADPNRVRSDGTKGSKHQAQKGGFGYAVDLRRLRRCPRWAKVHRIFKPFGLHFPVYRPRREKWHVTAYDHFEDGMPVWLPIDPAYEQRVQKWRDWLAHDDPDDDGWAAVAAFVADVRKMVLRRGDKGPPITFLQTQLNKADTEIKGQQGRWPTLKVDGDFGPATEDAVEAFQESTGHHPGGEPLKADGIVGKKTWKALING